VEDHGGPVVPKLDCPHLKHHVKFRIQNGRMQIVNNDENNGTMVNPLSEEFQRLCLEGNLMTSPCQYSSGVLSNKGASRKRLRSEDEKDKIALGRLKCEEDYDELNEDNNMEGECCSKVSSSPKCSKGENWLCLECGALMCSRYANGHAKMHYEDTKEEASAKMADKSNSDISEEANVGVGAGHCVAVSLADLSVWCYECNAYLQHPSLEALTKHLEEIKFGNDNDNDESNKNDETERENETGGNYETNDGGGDTKDGMEKDSNCAGDLETLEDQANADSNSINGSSEPKPSISKRKSQPQKLPPEQVGTTTLSHHQQQSSDGTNTNHSHNDENNESQSSDSSSSSDEEDESGQAAMLASLLQGEHGDALRAYLARHESFDTSNMGQCVPMHLPKPPSFPNEIADFLRSPLCKSIIVLAGAGMSVSSGIPDFRSAGVGLYDTLRPELLTASKLERALIHDDPTLALDKGMFLENPLPMLETKRSFILGTHGKRWKATLAHRFVELLHTKLGKLTRVYTQNIDGLELQCTGLPREKVVNVHGSMGAAACERCGQEMDFDEFCEKVRCNIKDITGEDAEAPAESTPIQCEACENPTVKPTIVLFRGSMPKEFHTLTAQDLPECDLLIVMGTSLMVAPANSLVYRIPPTALRMVMNNERVGRRLGIDYSENSIRDVYAHGQSDETCLELAEKMGWLDDLATTVEELPDSSARLLRERLAQRRQEE